MKLENAIEGGLTGATTISLLGETLRKIDGNSSHHNVFDGKGLKKRFKKVKSKKSGKSTKEFIQLAGDLLGSTSFLGLSSLGKKKNAALRGALLGAAAGLGAVLLSDNDEREEKEDGHKAYASSKLAEDTLLTKATHVALFTAAGFVAGKLIQGATKNKKKKKK
jgi:hypothetical protein